MITGDKVMDENLARWIFASVAKHFSTVASGLSLPYFVEGIDERDDTTQRVDHVECRVTGPSIKEVSRNWYKVEVGINFLMTKQMAIAGADAYDIVRWTGTFANAMLEPVPVYKYGPGTGDDKSLIGCLVIKKDRAEAVKIWHFGQISMEDRIKQSEVDALYGMELTSI